MSFLDNFSFAFQKISLTEKKLIQNDFGEPISGIENSIHFMGIIQTNKNISQDFPDGKNLLKMHEAEAIMRTNTDILPKISDEVESFETKYRVIFVQKVIIEGSHDHNLAFLKFLE